MPKTTFQRKHGVFVANGRLSFLLVLLLATICCAWLFDGCATTSPDPFEARLEAMSDDELVSYYRGINDRLKEIQAGTREADRQGTVLQNDHIAQMPYITGGEAYQLEQKRMKVSKAIARRKITP